ncbi:MAG: Helicase associated domain protein [Sulfurimonas sp.]|jgi:superfamily II DNA or RNA helicase
MFLKIDYIIGQSSKKMNKLKPFTHQSIAINDILYSDKGLLQNDRTQFISACGTGKTYTALWVVEKYIFEEKRLQKSLSVFFYPSLALISQSFKNYASQTTITKYKPLFVCSDQNITKNNEDINIQELKEEVGNNTVTTQKDSIKEYLKDSTLPHKVIFSTYQSSSLIVDALMEMEMKVDIAIHDEAHNIALKKGFNSKSATLILHGNKNFSFANKFFNVDKRLFMTATPKHIATKVKNAGDFHDVEMAYSMDNKEYFGEVSHELPMREAIEQGIISDYQIIGIQIDREYMTSYFSDVAEIKQEHIDIVKTIAIEKAMNKYNVNKGIIFHKTIEHSKLFTKNIKKHHKGLIAEHIDGSMGMRQKKEILSRFLNQDRFLLSNSKLLSEGVDIPTVDMVAFMNITGSLRDIVQRVGRVQRIPSEYKQSNLPKSSYIFIPIMDIELELNEEVNRDALGFYTVVNSLKSVDKQLADVLEQKISSVSEDEYALFTLRLQALSSKQQNTMQELQEIKDLHQILNALDIKENRIKIENISELNSTPLSRQTAPHKFKKYKEHRDRFVRYIDAIILNGNNQIEKKWEENYLIFQEFYIRHKRLPSQQELYMDFRIGVWVSSQLQSKKKGLLSKNRYERLNLICSDFFEDKHEEAWAMSLRALKQFYKKYKRLPKEKETHGNINIGKWLVNQRRLYRIDELDTNRIKKLEKIDKDIFESMHKFGWQKNLHETSQYFKNNNKLPSQYDNGCKQLGVWLVKQKQLFTDGTLSLEKVNKLLAIDKSILSASNKRTEMMKIVI